MNYTKPVDLEACVAGWHFASDRSGVGLHENGPTGPTIRAKVGGTLVVRLRNRLPEPTSIHWHGRRVPADMAGTELVQQSVRPGEGFEHRFQLPDT